MNHTVLTLITSFCLSSLAYHASQDQVEILEFDPIVITAQHSTIVFEETEIRSDGDAEGIDWDHNEEFWCATHPDECLIDTNLQGGDDDDDDDSDEEFGC